MCSQCITRTRQGSSLIDAGLHVVKDDLWGEILDQSIEQNPENLQLVETRAKRYVREERYLEAAHDYARFASISRSTPGIHALNTASLFALSGDRQAYQSYCQSQIKLLEDDDITGVDGFEEKVTNPASCSQASSRTTICPWQPFKAV